MWFQFILCGTFIYRKPCTPKFILVTQNQYKVFANYYGAGGMKIGGRGVICQIAFIVAPCGLFFQKIRFRGRVKFAESREPACEVPCVQVYEHPCRKWCGNYVCTFARVRHNISISARNVNYTCIYNSII